MPWTKISNIKGPTGATGSTGPTGPQGSPGVGITWRGVWSNSTAYSINDAVQRTNQSYICTLANTANDPATDTTHWSLMAGQGGDSTVVGQIIAWPSVTPPVGYLLCDGSAQSRATYSSLFSTIGTTFGAGDGSTTFNLPDLRSRMVIGAGQGASLTNRALAATGGEETHALTVAELASHTHTCTATETAHTHTMGNHTHGLGGHVHNMDHYHYCPGVNHLHGLGGHVHSGYYVNIFGGNTWGGGSGISYGGANANTGGPSTASDACDRSIAFNSYYASQTNSAWVNTGGPSGGSDGPSTNTTDATTATISATNANTGSGTAHNTMPPFLVLTYCIRASYSVPVAGPSVPLADTTQSGLVCKMSGNQTDYIGGDNAVHALPASMLTTVSVAFTIPSLGASVSITVASASDIQSGCGIYIVGGGFYYVQSIAGNVLTCVLMNVASSWNTGQVNVGARVYINGIGYNATGGQGGLVPASANTKVNFLRDDGAWALPVSSFIAKSAAYTITSADVGKYFLCTGSGWTLTLPAAAPNLFYRVRNDQGIVLNGAITIAAQAGSTIDGSASIQILCGQQCDIITDGTNWRTCGLHREVVIGILNPSAVASLIINLPAGYAYFELEINKLSCNTGTPNLQMQCSTDGSTFITTGYYGMYWYNSASTAVSVGTYNNASSLYVTHWLESAARHMVNHRIFPGDAGSYLHFSGQSGGMFSTNSWVGAFTLSGFTTNAGRMAAIQLVISAGTFSGQVILKGIV